MNSRLTFYKTNLLLMVLAVLLTVACPGQAQVPSFVSREFSLYNNPTAVSTPGNGAAFSRELSLFNDPVSVSVPGNGAAISREFSLYNNQTVPSLPGKGGAVSREFSLFNSPTSVTSPGNGQAISREFSVLLQSPLSINDVSIREGDEGSANATFTVTLAIASTIPTTVAYATSDGTATNGANDFQFTSGVLRFDVGETSKTVTVRVQADKLLEANETFFVNLANPDGAYIGKGQGVGTIIDDDGGSGCTSVTNGLVSWWTGDGNAFDLMGANPGALQSGATFSAGKIGQAFRFDGVDDYLSTPLDIQPSALPSMTWEGWVYPERVNHNVRQYIFSADDNGYDRSLTIEAGGANIGVFVGNTAPNAWPADVATVNQWQHIAVVYTPTGVTFYKNGQKTFFTSAPTGQASANKYTMGRNPIIGAAQSFKGLIDEAAVYNRALSEVEVGAIFANSAAGKCLPTRTPPSAPVLISPADNADVALPWNLQCAATDANNSALYYKIEFLQNGEIVRVFDQLQNPAEWDKNSYSSGATATLSPTDFYISGTYQWRAQAFNGRAWGPLSATRTFKFDNTPELCGGVDLNLATGVKRVFSINIPATANYWVTLQKREVTWNSTVRILKDGDQKATATGASDLRLQLTDPVPGIYTVEITATQGGAGVLRLCTELPELALGKSLIGNIYHNDGNDWSQLDVPSGLSKLTLIYETPGTAPSFDIWRGNFGSSETWHGTTSITITAPKPGRYYIQSFDHGQLTGGTQVRNYTLTAGAQIAGATVSPNQGDNAGPITVTITGSGFVNGSALKLTKSGSPDIAGSGVSVASDGSSMTATFDLTGKAVGSYSLVVTPPTGAVRTFVAAFTVVAQVVPLTVSSVTPDRIGNTGEATIVLTGTKLGATTTVKLDGASTLTADRVSVVDSNTLEAHFTLNNAPVGLHDLIVTNPGGATVTKAGAVTVETLAQPTQPYKIQLDVSGSLKPRVGRSVKAFCTLTNIGQVDVPYVMVAAKFSGEVKIEFHRDADTLPHQAATENVGSANSTKSGFVVRNLRAGQQRKFTAIITQFAAGPFQASLDAYTASTAAFIASYRILAEKVRLGILAQPNLSVAPQIRQKAQDANVWWHYFAQLMVDTGFIDMIPVGSQAIGRSGASAITNCRDCEKEFAVEMAVAAALTEVCVYTAFATVVAVPAVIQGCFASYAIMAGYAYYHYDLCVETSEPCPTPTPTPTPTPPGPPPVPGPLPCQTGLETWEHNESGAAGCGTAVEATDPNEKFGPAGFGDSHFINSSNTLSYAIDFQNKPTATASAQDVIVTDQLDGSKVDFETFALGPVSFGDKAVVPPSGSSEYSTTVDLRPAQNLVVSIQAELNKTTGLVTWRLNSLDPDTGLPPEDALAGFLPPDKNPPEGQGTVQFTIKPKAGVPNGTEVRNKASIVFDVNAPIVTNEWLNTLEGSAPVSHVLPLPATLGSVTIPVQWTGTDEGSGIGSYTIFVSVDDGPFAAWLTDTTLTQSNYTGQNGHKYEFYSIARDNTGQAEDAPALPDATTAVAVLNNKPVAVPQALVTNEDTAIDITLAGADGDNDPLAYAIAGQPAHGTLTLKSAPNVFTYLPALNYNGPDSFTFTVDDEEETSAPATISLTVTPARDLPTMSAIGDLSVEVGQASKILAVTVGDTETPVADLKLSGVSSNLSVVANSGIVFSGTGTKRTVTIQPVAKKVGESRITLTVTDGDGDKAQRTFLMTVKPPIRVETPGHLSAVQALPLISGTAIASSGVSGTAKVAVTLRRRTGSNATEYWGLRNGAWDWGASSASTLATVASSGWALKANSPAGAKLPSGSSLADGLYYVSAVGTDRAGISQTSATNTFTVDTQVPSATIADPLDGSGVAALAAIKGSATDGSGSGVARVELSLRRNSDGKFWSGSAWVDDAGVTLDSVLRGNQWVCRAGLPGEPNLVAGPYYLVAYAYDQAGNRSAGAVSKFVVDRTAPLASIVSPASGSGLTDLPAIKGLATDTSGSGIARVALSLRRNADNKYWGGSSWVGGVNTTIEATVSGTSWLRNSGLPTGANLPGGAYIFTAFAYDKAGNRSAGAISKVIVDRTSPVVAIVTPADGTGSTAFTVIKGSANDGNGAGVTRVTVSLRRGADSKFWTGTEWGTTEAVNLDTTISGPSWQRGSGLPVGDNLAPGAYTLAAYAYDKAGNKSAGAVSRVLVDRTLPLVTLTTPANGAAVTALPAVLGTATDTAGSGIDYVTVSLRRGSDNKYWTGSAWGTTSVANLETALTGLAWRRGSGLPAGADLGAGAYTLVAYAFDKAGNRSAGAASRFSVVSAVRAAPEGDSGDLASGPQGRPTASSVTLSSATADSARDTITLVFTGVLENKSAVSMSRYAVRINGQDTVPESAAVKNRNTVVLGLAEGSLRSRDAVVVTYSVLDAARKEIKGEIRLTAK